MSDYHILRASNNDQKIHAVFHIPIPDIDNQVNVSYRTALTQAEPFTESAVPWDLDAAEVTKLTAGELYERVDVVNMDVDSNLTNAQKLAAVVAKYSDLVSRVQGQIQARLKYWGKEGNA